LGQPEGAVLAWIGTWISKGLGAVEAMIGEEVFCFGEAPGLADIYVVPQVFAARRFQVPLHSFPKIRRVEAMAADHAAFQKAHPNQQTDFE
jgi:glutathione S-transferase